MHLRSILKGLGKNSKLCCIQLPGELDTAYRIAILTQLYNIVLDGWLAGAQFIAPTWGTIMRTNFFILTSYYPPSADNKVCFTSTSTSYPTPTPSARK